MSTQSIAALTLNRFGVSFGKRVVLDGVTLSLPLAGIDVLMGPVKTGKSTLLRTLSGMYDGHALHKAWGEVLVNGLSPSATNRPALILQHASVLNMTLLQALLDPLRKTVQHSPVTWRNLGLGWLADYGLAECIPLADQPTLQTPVRLQRAIGVLSQALLQPPLLMVDEPTFSLSDADAAWLLAWLKQLSSRHKLWVSLHNQLQAKDLADRILLLGGGNVIAHLPTAEFFRCTDDPLVAQFLRTGSLSLPAPDALPQDLEAEVAPPPPLSPRAQQAVQPPPQARDYRPVTPVRVQQAPVSSSVDTTRSSVPRSHPPSPPMMLRPKAVQAVTKVNDARLDTTRKLAALPSASRYGVEQAAAVGNVFFHDSSAPRGFHWIVPGKLAGCPAPGVVSPIDYDMSLLAKTGITKLVTLTEVDLDQHILQKHGLTNIHLPIFDRESPSINQTHMLLVRMQKFIDTGERLAVHCKAGLGRTGTILAAWLIREGGLSADDAIARLRRINNGYIQSQDQEDFLHSYEADLLHRLL